MRMLPAHSLMFFLRFGSEARRLVGSLQRFTSGKTPQVPGNLTSITRPCNTRVDRTCEITLKMKLLVNYSASNLRVIYIKYSLTPAVIKTCRSMSLGWPSCSARALASSERGPAVKQPLLPCLDGMCWAIEPNMLFARCCLHMKVPGSCVLALTCDCR